MNTVSQQLDTLLNAALLKDGKPEVAAALKLLRDPVAALEAERDQQQAKLDHVHKMGLRFGMMKSSDRPEPYLMHTWTKDSDHERMFEEWSHSIGWEQTVDKLKARIAELEARTDPSLFEPITTLDRNPNGCGCRACNPRAGWMIACHKCGNKRCPHGENHAFACTNSNEVGQIGAAPAQWRPIESAPRDGCGVLAFWADLYNPGVIESFGVVRWTGKRWLDEDGITCSAPTHFIPLPTPPTE